MELAPVFLSPRGGLWMRWDAIEDATGLKPSELKRALTHRKKLYRSEKVSRGWREVWAGDQRYIRVPRLFAQVAAEDGQCDNLLHGAAPPGRPAPAAAEPAGIDLFDYQLCCADAVMEQFFPADRVRAGHALGYLNMPAGRGKTPTGAEVLRRVRAQVAAAPAGDPMHRFGVRAVIVAPRSVIELQWVETIADHIPGIRVVLLAQEKPENRDAAIEGADAVVITPAMAMKFGGGDWARFGLVIIDEAHVMAAEKWQHTLAIITSARVLGLSATTDERTDGMDRVAYWYLGQPVHATELPGYDAEAVAFHGELRVVEVCDRALSRELRGLEHAAALQVLHAWPPWVALVVSRTLQLLRAHETEDLRAGHEPADAYAGTPARLNVAVFVEHREAVFVYAAAIRAALADGGGGARVVAPEAEDPDVPAALLGGVAGADLVAAIANARVIVTTYSYSAIGVSFNRFNAQIMATTRRSQLYQIMHRVMRINSDTSIGRRFVCLVGPRKNWKDHARAIKSCARGEGIEVVTEKLDSLDGLE